MDSSSELLQMLGYIGSEHWIATDETLPSQARLLNLSVDSRIIGAYTIQTSPKSDYILPRIPVVYVAKAQTESEAREIHHILWNLGKAPFVIVILSGQVRVYTGFNYDKKTDAGLITFLGTLTLDAVAQGLKAFAADQIDCGQIWKTHGDELKPQKRVDQRLLKNLQELGTILVKEHRIPPTVAHALIGKYIYIRYLRDRNILSDQWLAKRDINFDRVIGRNANAQELFRLTRALEERFKGQVFPISSQDEKTLTNEDVSFVASVFKGDETSGQQALDFQIYDFSYIPVEILSSIYEQFLHREGSGRKVGAYYTPEPVADYLLREINSIKPLQTGMTVFDPCCGSGIFLVLAYRRLIEMELGESPSGNLRSVELRRILEESIFGVERNLEACYVTEFSLLLTLLSYVDPPELHRNEQFRFPELHNRNIHQCDFFDEECNFLQSPSQFDWIVGNPPWFELDPIRKDEPDTEPHVRDWIQSHSAEYPVARNRVCEAFTWRVGEFLKENGAVGLLSHATSLTNDQSKSYRKAFFQKHQVRRITNFSHFAYILFQGRAKTPAATLVYQKHFEGENKPDIIHYGPFPVNQSPTVQGGQKAGWVLTVYENDIQAVESFKAENGDALTWKLALWGSHRDERNIERAAHLFPKTLGELIKERGWVLNAGLQVRDESLAPSNEVEIESALKGMNVLNRSKIARFAPTLKIPSEAIEQLPESVCYIRTRGGKEGLKTAYAPHVFISPGYAAYSDVDFVILNPQIGLAAPATDRAFLQAVTVLLNSSIIRYLLFFGSSSWGTDRTKIVPTDVRSVPFPLLDDKQIAVLSNLQQELAAIEKTHDNRLDGLRQQLDETVEQILKIPHNMAIMAREFVNVRLQFNQGVTSGSAASRPSQAALRLYTSTLRDELDEFAGIRHRVTLQTTSDWILCNVDATTESQKISPVIETASNTANYQAVWSLLKEEFSQWIYVQRSLRVFHGSTFHIFKAARLIDWTQTQALHDADDIIAEVLNYQNK